MAVVIANTISGGSKQLYDAVSSRVTPDGQLPDGCQVHIAGPVNEGWRVITVWDSEKAFSRFREEKLIPAIRELAGDEAVAPSIEANAVDTLLLA
jgi:hypothetical protein